MNKMSKVFLFLACIAIIGGITTGAGLSALRAKGGMTTLSEAETPVARIATGAVTDGQVFGSSDTSTFKDNTEGYLAAGGIEGEGSHHLLRAGGPTQTVYLTSSVTDLSKFEGMCVKVWGETFKGQKAGWLMDLGRVQVVDTKCAAPFDESAQATKTPAKNSKTPVIEDSGE